MNNGLGIIYLVNANSSNVCQFHCCAELTRSWLGRRPWCGPRRRPGRRRHGRRYLVQVHAVVMLSGLFDFARAAPRKVFWNAEAYQRSLAVLLKSVGCYVQQEYAKLGGRTNKSI